MFHLMRNTHLVTGLLFTLMAVLFAASSIKLAYRSWFPNDRAESAASVHVQAAQAADAEALARTLMAEHGYRGETRRVREDEGSMAFALVRPGHETQVEYDRVTGEVKILDRRYNFWETIVQLHVNHGFWHDFMPSNLWALWSVLASLGLLALGATGVYLWFAHHKERWIGGVILGVGLAWGLGSLVWTAL